MENNTYQTLEQMKHTNKKGIDFWFARELQSVLEYTEWRNFANVIDKAKTACKNSGIDPQNHFVDVNKTISMPKNATKIIEDYALTRYACYLLVQNGDPQKEVIAQAQTYFAVKTREQEIQDTIESSNENQKRLSIRKEIAEHNKSLAEAAQMAGITEPIDYALFQNEGYKGLYGGLTNKDIHERKGLSKNQQILDHMGSTELAANLFRATQTDEKIRRENIKGKIQANKTHYEVGKKVRQTIAELGGTMPEDLPTPEKSIKELKRENPLLKDKTTGKKD